MRRAPSFDRREFDPHRQSWEIEHLPLDRYHLHSSETSLIEGLVTQAIIALAHAPGNIIRRPLLSSGRPEGFEAREPGHLLGYSGSQLVNLNAFATKFCSMAVAFDCELAESNPLVETKRRGFVAADLRLIVDDNSLFRHQPLLEANKEKCPTRENF